MKDCNQNLAERLNRDNEFICCDLYTLRLNNGNIYRVADYDKDITFDNALYKHDLFIMSRDQTKQSGTPSVDTLSVTIYADKSHSDNIEGKSILKAVHDGSLDDAYLSLVRCFMDAENGTQLGVIRLFQGECEVSSVGGMSCKLTVKSETLGLNAQYPIRIYAPQNVYQEADGEVSTAPSDAYTCMIPLKPSRNVLVKL